MVGAVTGIEGIEPRIAVVSSRPDADLDAAFAAARPRLVRVARSLVGEAAAEDVVHDTYLTARSRIAQLRDPLALEGWLIRICVHRAFRVQRRGRRLHELLDRLPWREQDRGPAPRASALELRELIEGLTPRERAVVILQHGYGYSLLEVAELVGISHANARKIASRARATLLRAWEEAEG
jgi:RNA polymerase sigma-70 factor (ECF subfamily)